VEGQTETRRRRSRRSGPCCIRRTSAEPVFRGIPFIITYLSAWQYEHTSVAKALYDYDAANPGELTIKEDEILHVYDKDDAWLLVHSQKPGGRVGFVPEAYVEAVRLIFIFFLLLRCMLIERGW